MQTVRNEALVLVLSLVVLLQVPAAWGYSVSKFQDPLTGLTLNMVVQNSSPIPMLAEEGSTPTFIPQSAVMLDNVPTSTWTYGCAATSAGMLFGYWDLHGFDNMYSGPYNNGVVPLTDLGTNCSLIATRNGFDGRTTPGHVDDYWKGTNQTGPDPWEAGGTEHAWADCTADFLGTNQWKWDFDENGSIESNADGATTIFYWDDGTPLYDYIPPASAGVPQTELTHGLRLFAESRGYKTSLNYTQAIDTIASTGFTYADYIFEIDHGYPVLIQLYGHTMVGVGYDNAAGNRLYVHDTWDNDVHQMTWGGSYGGMTQFAVTVYHAPEPGTVLMFMLGLGALVAVGRRRRKDETE